jgi:hypothetical protein
MASSFIHPLDQNPSSPSSKQRRRNAALSCAECRRYSRFLRCPVNWLIISANKAQVEVRTSGPFRFYHYKLSSPLTDVAVSFPARAASRKVVPQYVQKVSMNVRCVSPVSCSRANSGSLTTGKGNRCAFFSLGRENFQTNTSTMAPQFHSREHRSAS